MPDSLRRRAPLIYSAQTLLNKAVSDDKNHQHRTQVKHLGESPADHRPTVYRDGGGSRNWLFSLLVCLSAVAAYAAVPWFQFVFDDRGQVVENPSLLHLSWIPQYFQHHVWSYRASAGPSYYRPLFATWLNLNYAFFGLHPAGWHIAVLCLHVLVCWLTYRLVCVVFENREIALAASLLFALHPVHVESVAWVSASTDLLAAVFVISSFLVHRRAQGASGWVGIVLRGASAACFAGALLAKETALLFPLLVLFDSLLLTRRGRKAVSILASTLPYFLVVVVYCLIRAGVLGGFSRTISPLPPTVFLLTLPSVLLFYLGMLLVPAGLSPFYDSPYVDNPDLLHFWVPLLVLTGVAALGYASVRRRPSSNETALDRRRCGFMLLWAGLFLLPALDLPVLDPGEIVHDRYLYLPSIGFLAVVAFALQRLAVRLSASKRAQALLLGGMALVLGAATAAQSLHWRNDLVLYQRGAAVAPDNVNAQNNLANSYLESGDYDRGIALHKKILEAHPRHVDSYFNIGMAYYNQSQFPVAEGYFRQALQLRPEPEWYFQLGLTQFKAGEVASAEGSLKQALRGGADRSGFHVALGAVYETEGKLRLALGEFELARALDPQNQPLQKEIEKIKQQLAL